jgi:D-alanyl-D-alanine carboxypeptidase
MSAPKPKASKERDAMRAQLAAMMSSSSAPGAEQAERAVKVQSESPKAPEKSQDSKVKPKTKRVPKKAAKKAPTKPKPKAAVKTQKPISRGGEEKAEKISVSLHPTDQDNAELIEDALREAGLITRRAPISFLLKVALASFDPSKVKNLPEIVQTIKAKDGRGRWAQEMSAKIVK